MVGLTWTLDARTASADGRGPRLGTLVSPGAPGEDVPVSIPTPALLTYTRRGEPAHLIPDVLDTLPPEARAFQTSLVHFMDHLSPSTVADHPAGGAAYFGSLPTFVLATARDPVTNDLNAKPSNAADATFVNTPVGVKRLTPADYMTWVRATRPHAFVALADESPGSHDGAPRKKIQAAARRTSEWLDACARQADGVPVFACVQGGAEVDERRASAASAATRDDVFGFSIGGLGAGETPGSSRAALLAASMEPLPKGKPRHVSGLGAPLEALACIEAGVDLIDASFCHRCTLDGHALRFPKGPFPKGAGAKRKRSDGDGEAKEDREEEEEEEEDEETRLATGGDAHKMNLWALAYRADTRAIVPGCRCFTCRHHSRAYVHHLLQAHEMTAQVLLDAHNYHHYFDFFAAARDAVGAGTFDAFAAFHRRRAANAASK